MGEGDGYRGNLVPYDLNMTSTFPNKALVETPIYSCVYIISSWTRTS